MAKLGLQTLQKIINTVAVFTGCRYYLLPFLPLPFLPVALFSVALFTVAVITVAFFTVALFSVNRPSNRDSGSSSGVLEGREGKGEGQEGELGLGVQALLFSL